ncbi:TetR/AcrR family transcriptional regulator [Paenibacillus sp. D2_2]|uniref:TetR/AcrR family transcriptional regulator n=1 Tax=Paenibacillus sp. D2_2 TaxID=3073092 RepID=UPI0028163B52|nr:TetR/AcrR family transcriptional regulator [Paenibacillus sp. D2_2]WMT43066.1 TetR/AcrR family transcriptional regulator [Paenibacillus sp. D2_2]
MSENYTDLRVIRTKNAIKLALIELVLEQGFESVSVKDITNKAGINRGTFYIHYTDKYDLMNKSQEEVMKELSSVINKHYPNIITEFSKDETSKIPFRLSVIIFRYLDENSDFIKAVLSPQGDLSFQLKLKRFMWEVLFHKNFNDLLDNKKTLIPKNYIISYVASAHIGIIQEWIENGKKESPEEMAHILSTITVNGAYHAAGIKR